MNLLNILAYNYNAKTYNNNNHCIVIAVIFIIAAATSAGIIRWNTASSNSVICIVNDDRIDSGYCDKHLCPKNVKHVGCKACYDFNSSCNSPKAKKLSSDLIKAIVSKHNELRNKIASGGLPPFKPAERMPTLKWNHELEYLAELNVFQCKMNHDDCRNTDTIPIAGQNLALRTSTIPLDENAIIISLIEDWFSEYKVTKPSDIESFPSVIPAEDISHFAAMVQDKNVYVGCGVSTYIPGSNTNVRALLLACNYGYDNVIGAPVYKTGSQCSKCSTGCNTPQYPALCNN